MRQRLLPNGLLAAAVAALLLASPWVSAAGADAAQVTVVSPGGAEQTLSLAALAGSEDLVAQTYTLRSAASESSQTLTGFSLGKLLDAAGVDPFGFSYLEVQRPAGGAVALSRHQALDPSAFADGPPLVYATANGTSFLRPSSGADDPNADDSFEAPQGVTLVLRKGESLQIRAHASSQRTKPGETVDFSAIVERAGSGEQLTYSWYFDDGHSASGETTSHSFAKRGSYDVVLGVTTPGDDAGASDVVTVQVGAPLSGPDRKGGGTNKDTSAPDHGAATGPESSAPGPPSAAVAAPPTPTAGERRPSRRQSRSQSPAEEPVSGELLSTAAATRPKQRVAARTGSLDGEDSGGSVPGTALGILTTIGLLGFGALVEVRGVANLLPGRL